jgi:hypothetical protein
MRPKTSPSNTELVALVYELLDGHRDTADLASELGLDCWNMRWGGHLDYLRALQRRGREALAQIEDQR